MSVISAVIIEEMSSKIEPTEESMPVKTQPKEKTMPVKTSLKEYRQKLMTIKARMRYREQTIKGFRQNLKNGTIPKRIKSLLPCPKLASPESQVILNAACDQVQSVILDQMMQEEEKKLSQDQDSYQRTNVKGLVRSSRHVKSLSNPLWLNCSKNSRTCSQIYPTL